VETTNASSTTISDAAEASPNTQRCFEPILISRRSDLKLSGDFPAARASVPM
jgi:hypothetical protein